MNAGSRVLAAASTLLLALFVTKPAIAQKSGGILRISHFDSPASMSLLEESTAAALRPVMGVFNNLVLYDQHVAQNSIGSIVPELATSWSWNEEGTELIFPLRVGVKWHDGKPFTAQDVKCTWDLLSGKASEKLRINPRKSWYKNVEEVSANGDYEVTFRLKRPQPALLALLASGWAPIYPCHVSPRDMRSRPIGTGPFKFVEFKPNEIIRVTKNRDYWREGRPYLDGIEWTIIKDTGTRNLAFIAGKVDLYSPHNITIPILKDIKKQAPLAICEVAPTNVNRTLIINRDKPPFDNPDLRHAMALTLDRKAFIDILADGQGDIGGTMLPGPEGVWAMSPEELRRLPGYDPDIAKNRAEARAITQKLGYGPDKRLPVTVSTRNVSGYRDAAVILIDQLKEIYIDGQLENIDTTQWYPRILRKDFTVGLNVSESAVDDPDQQFYENYVCTAERNYTGYCRPEVDKLVDQQSAESDKEKRKQLVWEIERRLAEDGARPVIFYPRQATCWYPQVKGMTMMVNSIYNGFRFEDLWLDN
ncbi:MAG TPA: ABC transporter substrate-binding protein [Steroidobacteraceae bacterium]|nr:ABC transporter substrate-binding protein [Steroidobacteraceae bacterium]